MHGIADGTRIARQTGMIAKQLVRLVFPLGVATIAFLHARTMGALVEAELPPALDVGGGAEEGPGPCVSSAGFVGTPCPDRAATKSAAAILARNPFDHTTSLAEVTDASPGSEAGEDDVANAPLCPAIRATVAVGTEDPASGFAAFGVDGAHILRARGGTVGEYRVAFVGADRAWLERDGRLCQVRVFAPPAGDTSDASKRAPIAEAGKVAGAISPLEADVVKKITTTGPNAFAIDRGALERILDAQTELMRVPLVPEKQGDRVIGVRLLRVKPGSALAALGLASGDVLQTVNGFETSDPQKILELYAHLRSGTTSELSLHVVRGGKPMNLDYKVL